MGIRWLPCPQHIADSPTKRHGNSVLLEVLKNGRWGLRETEEVRHERERIKQLRKRAADRRKRSASETASPSADVGRRNRRARVPHISGAVTARGFATCCFV